MFIIKGLKCRNFPGPGAKALVNPMSEFIHNDQSNVHSQFQDFKNKHNKKYETQIEHAERLHTFRQNLRLASLNSQHSFIEPILNSFLFK